jgi:hypothetical protein
MFSTQAQQRTRVVSLNTDSILVQVAEGDQGQVDAIIKDWEQSFGFAMERVEVLAHRGLNINSYLEAVREGDGVATLKSKGLLAHDPGISADHDRLIVAKAVGQWMLDGSEVASTIQAAAARRDILLFTEMRSAPSSGLRLDGQPIGRLARVYRSTRVQLPRLTRDATANSAEQVLEPGFAVLDGTNWPGADDVDVDWYIRQAQLLIAQTDVPYSPHHNTLAQELQALGLRVAGVGGAATTLAGATIDRHALASGTEKNPRNHSGDRGLAVAVTKSSGVVGIAASGFSPNSLVLAYGRANGQIMGEIHCRHRLAQAGMTLRQLRRNGAVTEKGHLTVYDPTADCWPLIAGDPATPALMNTAAPEPAANYAAPPASAGHSAAEEQLLRDNDSFLAAIFGVEVEHAFVCSHTVPPDCDDDDRRRGIWKGGPRQYSRGLYRLPQRQNYTCVSTFMLDREGVYHRKQDYFSSLHFVVLDDIGTKVNVDPRTLGFGEPTMINETSPGNQQWIYRLRKPLRDYPQAMYLTKEVLAMPVKGHLLTDQGARGLTRLCKLPIGVNLKKSLGETWQNRVLSWRPDLAYEAQEIAAWFGADLSQAPSVRPPVAADAAAAAEHPLIQALQAEELLLAANAKSSGWWDIRCIQAHLHSNEDQSGTAIKVKDDGSWTMVCQHGHCANLKPRDLYRYLVDAGHDTLTPPQYRLNVRRQDPSRLQFDDESDHYGADDEFAFMDPDDGGAGDEVVYPDPELEGQGPTPPSGVAGTPGVPPAGPKPDIFIDPGHLPRIVRQCAALLNEVVFKRGSNLVRIGRGCELSDGLQRSGVQPVVLGVTKQWLVRELTDRATFKRWDKRLNDYKVIDCPTNVASTVETGTDDDTFRPLTAMASTPFLRGDGRICVTPGYDDETGIYYAPNLTFPSIPEQPTWQEARVALDQLLALVKEFPFANEVSKSVFLADVLTALARPTLSKSPAILYCATMAGTGKTLMASIANLIVYGHATLHPWPHGNEEELKKVFTSILLAGDPVVVFDNVPNGAVIKSAALSQFVTSDEYADRKLGESQRVRFKNRTRVVLTGNNVTLASDNARRTLVCDLQLQCESARDRHQEFEVPDLSGYIKANRAQLIVAGLTTLRAYALHPQPLRLKPLESFEDWSWRVRDALIWLGQEDPVAAVQFDNDGTGEIAQAFVEIETVATAKRSTANGTQFRANDLANWAATNHVLRDALEQAGCADPLSTAKVGYWLRSLKNRIAGSRRLMCQQVDGGRQPNRWVIELSAGAAT